MKAISMYQPWAYWVSFQIKTIETRLHTRFKGLAGQTIGIHACLKYDEKAFAVASEFVNYNYIEHQKNKLVYGAVICTAFVDRVGWLNGSHSRQACIDCENVERFGLFLKNVKPLKNPFYCIGRQGPFNVDIDGDFERRSFDMCDGIKVERLFLELE